MREYVKRLVAMESRLVGSGIGSSPVTSQRCKVDIGMCFE